MALSTNDEAKIREYLLGQLSEEEQLAIEERLMIEDDLVVELEISKSELIEDYRSGDLSEPERESFEQNFLASLEGRQKYTFSIALARRKQGDSAQPAPAIALARRKQGDSPQPAPHPVPAPVGFFSRLPHWANVALASLVVLVVVSILVYRALQPPTVLSLELPITTSATRGSGPRVPAVQLDGVDQLRLTLILPASAPAATRYRAKLLEENDTGDGRDVEVVGHEGGKVSVVIPSGELPPSEYDVMLFAVKADGSEIRIGNYFFDVQ